MVQLREGGRGGVSGRNVLGRQNQYDEQAGCLSQKRSGKGVRANSMTLDWPTQKSGLSHADLGVPEMELVLWLKSHLKFVTSENAGWGNFEHQGKSV